MYWLIVKESLHASVSIKPIAIAQIKRELPMLIFHFILKSPFILNTNLHCQFQRLQLDLLHIVYRKSCLFPHRFKIDKNPNIDYLKKLRIHLSRILCNKV